LARNRQQAARIQHGLVVACVGDSGPFHYTRSRRPAAIDRAVEYVLRASGAAHTIHDFTPYGYDERQYCSPGFDLPVGSLTRTPHGQFAEYHTSADDLRLVSPRALAESLRCYLRVIAVIERNQCFRNTHPYGEPQLGRRGLYRAIGGPASHAQTEMALLWVLNQSDGSHSLLDIAERSQLDFEAIQHAAEVLCANGLLEAVADPPALHAR
jgi:aminopeptidase-like protein